MNYEDWLAAEDRYWRWLIDYLCDVVQLADGSFYWHLFYRGERVNGGLSATREDARADSASARVHHHADEVNNALREVRLNAP